MLIIVLSSLSQQPIYEMLERISPTERDLMMKLEKSQMRVVEVRLKFARRSFYYLCDHDLCVQLEGEREKAEKELKAQKEKVQYTYDNNSWSCACMCDFHLMQ